MRFRIALILGSITALAIAFTAVGQAESGFKVTGGGQTDFGDTGPGDTIAFTAQNVEGDSDTAAKGQVQYVDREEGKVVGIYHGTVTCLAAVATETDNSQGAGILAGEWSTRGRPGTTASGPFEIFVEDNGEPNQGNDAIFIDQTDGSDCSDSDDDDGRTALGRGNVQVHNYTAPE